MTKQINKKRMAKNTLILYFRMFLVMGLALYTSRIVLDALGVEDFGIYNVVGGVVVMFEIFNSAMITSTQRFLSFYLGKRNFFMVSQVFTASLKIHISIALGLIAIGESLGLWILYEYINIPAGKENVALLVYQFALLSSAISVIRAPFQAAIISKEKMSIYAYISVFENLLRLGIAFLLFIKDTERLFIYSILMCFSVIIITLTYILITLKFDQTFRLRKVTVTTLYKQILNFSGWSILGGSSNMFAVQGVNIVINNFFGVSINAAIGIAHQVYVAVTSFVSNFQTAINPQLVKGHAAGEAKECNSLIMQSSKFSYLLFWMLALPLLATSDSWLNIWLTTVPEYSSIFSQILIIYVLLDALQGPMWIAILATGNIKNYQIVTSVLILSSIPIVILLMLIGFPPFVGVLVRVAVNFFLIFFRLSFLKKLLDFNISDYIKTVIFPIIVITILSTPLVWLCKGIENDFLQIIIAVFTSVISVTILVSIFALNKVQRIMVLNKIKSAFLK